MDDPSFTQENVDIEIKPDIGCFEFIKADDEDAIDDSVLTNEIMKEGNKLNIDLKENCGIINQNSIMDFATNTDGDVDNVWSTPAKNEAEQMACGPPTENKVNPGPAVGQPMISTAAPIVPDISPTASQGLDMLFLFSNSVSKMSRFGSSQQHMNRLSLLENSSLNNPIDEKPLKCTSCPYSAVKPCHLVMHMRIHTGERPYKCTVCEYTASQSSHLKTHMKTHTGEKPYKCPECDYSASQSGTLKEHIRVHTRENPYKCPLCEYCASQKGALKRHIRRHTGEKPYKCTECEYTVSQSGTLREHMKKHTGERPFKCTECDYSAARSTHLKRHMGRHSSEKPYKCTECEYSAAQSESLKEHMKVHTGERPFKCNLCDYSATRSTHLKRHMARHTGEKPYKCKECDYAASQAESVKKHMRVHRKLDNIVPTGTALRLVRKKNHERKPVCEVVSESSDS